MFQQRQTTASFLAVLICGLTGLASGADEQSDRAIYRFNPTYYNASLNIFFRKLNSAQIPTNHHLQSFSPHGGRRIVLNPLTTDLLVRFHDPEQPGLHHGRVPLHQPSKKIVGDKASWTAWANTQMALGLRDAYETRHWIAQKTGAIYVTATDPNDRNVVHIYHQGQIAKTLHGSDKAKEQKEWQVAALSANGEFVLWHRVHREQTFEGLTSTNLYRVQSVADQQFITDIPSCAIGEGLQITDHGIPHYQNNRLFIDGKWVDYQVPEGFVPVDIIGPGLVVELSHQASAVEGMQNKVGWMIAIDGSDVIAGGADCLWYTWRLRTVDGKILHQDHIPVSTKPDINNIRVTYRRSNVESAFFFTGPRANDISIDYQKLGIYGSCSVAYTYRFHGQYDQVTHQKLLVELPLKQPFWQLSPRGTHSVNNGISNEVFWQDESATRVESAKGAIHTSCTMPSDQLTGPIGSAQATANAPAATESKANAESAGTKAASPTIAADNPCLGYWFSNHFVRGGIIEFHQDGSYYSVEHGISWTKLAELKGDSVQEAVNAAHSIRTKDRPMEQKKNFKGSWSIDATTSTFTLTTFEGDTYTGTIPSKGAKTIDLLDEYKSKVEFTRLEISFPPADHWMAGEWRSIKKTDKRKYWFSPDGIWYQQNESSIDGPYIWGIGPQGVPVMFGDDYKPSFPITKISDDKKNIDWRWHSSLKRTLYKK